MRAYDILRTAALTAVTALYGCNGIEQAAQPEKPQPSNLETRIEGQKTTDVVRAHGEPIANRKTFLFTNYKRPKEWGGFDVDPITAPDFSARLKDGRTIRLQELADKQDYVMLQFSTNDCGICWDIAPRMDEFYAKNKQNIEILTLVGTVDDKEWSQYLARSKAHYLIAQDKKAEISTLYGFEFVPSYVLMQSVPENGKKVLKVISVCHGGAWGADAWLGEVETTVTWDQMEKVWLKELEEKKARKK